MPGRSPPARRQGIGTGELPGCFESQDDMDQLTRPGAASQKADSDPAPAPELAVVVPTYNERDNVPLIIDLLKEALDGISFELIFVDDNSPDGTAAAARALGEADRRVRCIRRVGRRGLAGACLEGMLATQAHYVAVLDADLQHDEALLPAMLQRLRDGDADLVVASRHIEEGSDAGLTGIRSQISRFAGALAQRLLRVKLSDPMSGFFMLRRAVVEDIAPSLSSQGFKILLDIVATSHSASSNCPMCSASGGTARASSMPISRSISPRC